MREMTLKQSAIAMSMVLIGILLLGSIDYDGSRPKLYVGLALIIIATIYTYIVTLPKKQSK